MSTSKTYQQTAACNGTADQRLCPTCGSGQLQPFYLLDNMPVHSVLLINTREEALSFPKGDIELTYCPNCQFISNQQFDPQTQQFSKAYEATQSFSATFRSYHRELANRLIERYNLSNGRVLEIGCGNGEFLELLTRRGQLEAVGFDPAYPADQTTQLNNRLTIIPDFYSEKYAHHQADLYCCKMTLEHIADPGRFIQMVRRSIGNQLNAVVFFQVPNTTRILKEQAFWDIYYEHCSYFNATSLRYLFEAHGFEVLDLRSTYADQYLTIEAKPAANTTPSQRSNDTLPAFKKSIQKFTKTVYQRTRQWKQKLDQVRDKQQRAVLWGSGSKAVAFLTTLKLQQAIDYVVDINPNKQNTFMAGTGQQIVAPQFLKTYRPDWVIAMNSVYRDEIASDLQQMNLSPRLLTVDTLPLHDRSLS